MISTSDTGMSVLRLRDAKAGDLSGRASAPPPSQSHGQRTRNKRVPKGWFGINAWPLRAACSALCDDCQTPPLHLCRALPHPWQRRCLLRGDCARVAHNPDLQLPIPGLGYCIMLRRKFQPAPAFEALRQELVSRFFSRDDAASPLFAAPLLKQVINYQRDRAATGTPGVLRPRDAAVHAACLESAGIAADVDRHIEAAVASASGMPIPRNTWSTQSALKAIKSRGLRDSGAEGGCADAAEPGFNAVSVALGAASHASVSSSARFCHNVIGPASDPSIVGAALGTVVNANLVDPEYSGVVGDLEQSMIRALARTIGYPDPSGAMGVFTSGGTMANTYGLLAGIRKAFPLSATRGLSAIPQGTRLRVASSAAGHYSNVTAMTTLGLDPRSQGLRVDINDRNEIDVEALRAALERCARDGVVVPSILLTMGTTDTFAVDDAAGVAKVLDDVCEAWPEFRRPHLHVDAAVGWPVIFMQSYDTHVNPLGLSEAALDATRALVSAFNGLRRADSVSIDWHKWGLVTYASSCVVFKDADSLGTFASPSELYSYFESSLAPAAEDESDAKPQFAPEPPTLVSTSGPALQEAGPQGEQQAALGSGGDAAAGGSAAPAPGPETLSVSATSQHPYASHQKADAQRTSTRPLHELTIECSRAATGVFAAQMHWQALGEEGMQLCVATSLHNAAVARHAIRSHPELGPRAVVLDSHGPSVAWRLQPPGSTAEEFAADARALFAQLQGLDGCDDADLASHPEFSAAIKRAGMASAYHHAVYRRREQAATIEERGLRTAWVGQVAHTQTTQRRRRRLDFAGEKAVFFNPATTEAMIEDWIAAIAAVDRELAPAWLERA